MKKCLLFICLCAVLSAQSQEGALDTSFDPGTGITETAKAISVAQLQPDGKIIIAGEFSSFNGVARNNIARLNADGSVDASFDPGTGVTKGSTSGYLSALLLLPDGKVIIGGDFTHYNGVARSGIARLNADGSLDTSFDPGTGVNDAIRGIHLLSDGKIIITGWFFYYNDVFRGYIARINPDGSLDTSYDPGWGAEDWIFASVMQPDEKLIITGVFSEYGNSAARRIARINTDGSLDTSFNTGSGLDDPGRSIVVLPDGKILVGGQFSTYNGVTRNGIVRLDANGSLDTSFDPAEGADGYVEAIAVQPDNRILIGGSFENYNGTARRGIARLGSAGELDTSFNPGTGVEGGAESVSTILLQPDGKIIITGNFATYNGASRGRIARINADPVNIVHVAKNETLFLSPNPSVSMLNISQEQPTPVELYSITGKLLVRFEAASHIVHDVSAYPPGVYLVKAANKIGRFVKQ